MNDFEKAILQGIPDEIPEMPKFDENINRAPKRRQILTENEKKLALKNALRYFPPKHHEFLAKEFLNELNEYGRIYMYRYRPTYPIYARNINDYPAKSKKAAAIMMMIQNNLDPRVAQHPYELIIYGGNGSIFQNWAQYLLTMKYLATMTDEQTLVMYSGHPMGLFPSSQDAPRVVVTNGLMVPNYSSMDDYDKYNALGVTQYGQMTAGSYMYIGPQGIVNGTTVTILNAGRKKEPGRQNLNGMLFVSSGLGGMSGAQPKAAKIAGGVAVIAEINPKPLKTRLNQGWLDEYYDTLDKLIPRLREAMANKENVSIGYLGNIVDLWERLYDENIKVDIGTDQTSLHNPYQGGYYPAGLTYEESNELMSKNPELFKQKVHESLKRQVAIINKHAQLGMYFFDYGNAFLLESSRAGADILLPNGEFRYPSYVQDIMGPQFFDFGFGPFRWVCTSGDPTDLDKTDKIAGDILEEMYKTAPDEIKLQLSDSIHWIRNAKANKLVVGSQARILYADGEARVKISKAFNEAIRSGYISAPIVLGRDHHDVSGTDSPFRETSNIYDGSKFTADMATHTYVGNAVRGATWVSLHNGGGVGWGEVINGGFGLVLDGSDEADSNLKSMLFWDVINGISRRSWARNPNALFTLNRALEHHKDLAVTLPNIADDDLINKLFE